VSLAQSFPTRAYRVCGLPPLMRAENTTHVGPPGDRAESTVTSPISVPEAGSATVLLESVGAPDLDGLATAVRGT